MSVTKFFGQLGNDGFSTSHPMAASALSETYAHFGAALWLFATALIAGTFIWAHFGRRQHGWLSLTSGIFFVGVIGLAEAAEYLFGPFWYDFFHYLHILAAPVSLVFLFLAVDELRSVYYFNAPKKFLSGRAVGLASAGVLGAAGLLAYQMRIASGVPVEMFVLSGVLIPTLVVAYALIRRSVALYREQHRVPLFNLSTVSTVLMLIPLMAWGAVMLSIVIWLGRVAEIANDGFTVAVFHAVQDLFYGGMGAVLLGSCMILVLAKDVKTTEDSVVQSSKLISLGEMAGEMAVELNTPLMSIASYATLLADDPDIPVRRRKDLKLIVREASKALDMTKQLFDFAGKPQPHARIVNVEEPLDEVISLMSGRLSQAGVKVVKSMQKPLPFVSIGPEEIKQAFVNVMSNAVDAMSGGGQLEVYVTAAESELEMCFTDTGTGMSKQTIDRIFDPFYSSKSDGGTGLGLSLALAIIKKHGGTMDVASQQGIGSTFTMRLPTISDSEGREISPPDFGKLVVLHGNDDRQTHTTH